MPRKKKSGLPPIPKKPTKRKRARYSSRQLTLHLREMAAEVLTMDDEGNLLTRGEALAELLWKKALGHETIDEKTEEVTYHKPEAWAISLIWERMEGKAPVAIPDDKGALKIAERVSELVRNRLNSYAEAAVAVPDPSGPVDLPDHRVESAKRSDSESDLAK